MSALLGWFVAMLRSGRHHVRTASRAADGGLVTVSTIAARIRREAWERSYGAASIRIVPDVHPFDASIRRALGRFEQPEFFAGAGAMA